MELSTEKVAAEEKTEVEESVGGTTEAVTEQAAEEEPAQDKSVGESTDQEKTEEAVDGLTDEHDLEEEPSEEVMGESVQTIPEEETAESQDEVAKAEEVIEESSENGETGLTAEVQGEEATVTMQTGEAVIESALPAEDTFQPGVKLVEIGEEGTVTRYPLNPERTNGFDDYRVDISSYVVNTYTLDKDEGDEWAGYNLIKANGEYKKLELEPAIPKSEYSWSLIDENKNVVRYDIQGPNVKKVLREKAYDKDVFFGHSSGCLSESGEREKFAFDQVASERITRRLHIPDCDLMTDLHSDIFFALADYGVDELRKYDTAEDFVNATGFMQSEEIYKYYVGSERTNRGFLTFDRDFNRDINAYTKASAEKNYASGYECVVDTLYANCMGIKEDSEWLEDFLKKYEDKVFSFCVKEGDTYWFAISPSDSMYNTALCYDNYVKYYVDTYFPGLEKSEYEGRRAAAFDELVYYVYYDFTYKDVCDAWLAEMNNWDGHWIYCLYGVYDREDIGEDDTQPGIAWCNWTYSASNTGKTTLHYPDQYDYYVKDPGIYTITATIDGCNGVITSQFAVRSPGWFKDDGELYYMQDNGRPAKGWLYVDDKQYYMNDSGVMTTGWLKIDEWQYYFGSNGVMVTDWQEIDDDWYYFDMSGAMQTGWLRRNGKLCYLDSDGAMQTGLQKINGSLYFFNASGEMQTGWQTVDGEECFFEEDGAMHTEHTWSGEYTADKEATCTEEGSESIHCSVCGAVKEGSSRIIPKKDHAYGEWTVTKEATCSETGNREKVCEDCGNKATETIPATGHAWEETYTTDKEATCAEEGSESINCAVCNAKKEGSSRTILKKDHVYGEWTVTKEASCTENGIKERVCSVCGEKETEEIPATGHKWSDTYTVDKEATCTEDGSESIHCEVCGAVKEDSSRVIPKGHKYGEWTVTAEATCTTDGSREKVCADCGDKVTESIPATGHKWNSSYTVDKKATVTEKGSESIHCSVCGAVKEGSSREIPMLNGSWKKNRSGWWYGWSDGTYLKGCFEEIGGKTYYFNASGYMVTGWQRIGGNWYHFSGSGVMQIGWLKIGAAWYYMGSDGVMQTGLQTIGNTKYFFAGSGAMKTGWQKIGSAWYFFAGSGAMKTGWLKSGSTWYYFNEEGIMQTGLQTIGNSAYFFAGSGAMQTGWQKIGSAWYYFSGSGAMVKNRWVGNYYLTEDGTMATNAWIGNYYVGADGKWIPGYKAA